jgi:hypothetical protein
LFYLPFFNFNKHGLFLLSFLTCFGGDSRRIVEDIGTLKIN